ncbi:MAG: anthranilate phosphoribosyltransferase [Planctomycetota bacterium]
MTEDNLKQFGTNIQRLINKENLSREETYQMFCEVLEGTQPDLQQGAFLSALVSKGETIDEIAGAWQAICEKDTVKAEITYDRPVIENSGTGMDSLKTFNVSSAAAVTAAACGAKVVRHGARALTSFCGTVDILESVGLDVECDVSVVEKSIEKEGIGLFNGMSPKVHPGGLGRILSQIRFGTTLNIAASLASPVKPTHGLRGVYVEELLDPVSQVMSSIGYQKGMVVHGKADGKEGGIDELSVSGESVIKEFAGDSVKSWKLRPEDAGLKTIPFSEIATTGDLQKESDRFLKTIAGKDHEGCIDFTCLNAGAALYVSGQAETIIDGVKMSRHAIESGEAMRKLQNWVGVQNTDPQAADKFDAKLSGLGVQF